MSGVTAQHSKVFQVAKTCTMCGVYIILSGGLISFNKYIMHKGRFPHAMALTTLHMFTSLVLCSLLYLVKPSLYPGVERTKGKRIDLYKRLIPIGICFAIMLYGSNKAYVYCSVAFLQFMKEANVVLVFCFSCVAGLQAMTRQRLVVIAWIILGSTLCVSGDVHFALMGFVCQGVSQLAECSRAVMAEIVLTGSEFRLDPLTYTMFVAPICLVVLIIGSSITWKDEIWTDAGEWWPLLIPNACIAFVLNVIIALIIKELSAVGFIVTGIVKDIVLVVFSSFIFRDIITTRQWISFMVTLSGVFFWSFMKIAPDHLAVVTFGKMLGVHPLAKKATTNEAKKATADESTPLEPGKKV